MPFSSRENGHAPCVITSAPLSEFLTTSLADAIAGSMPLGVSAFGKGGSLEFEGSNVLTFAGGMYVPDRWVYFALLLNWTDAEAGPGSQAVGAYIAAASTIFTLVRDRLSV